MADWISTWPVAVASIVLLIAPGIGPAYALGLRGLVAWGSAPLLAGAVVGAVAVGTGALGLGWNVGWVVLGSVLVSGLAFGAWHAGGRRSTARLRPGARRRAVALAVGVGGVVAVGLQMRRVMTAIGGPNHVAQTVDVTYHLNATQMILDTGDASSLHMTMTTPMNTSNFYPALWHDFTSLVVQVTGVSVPAAANWTTIIVTAVVWPLCLLALVRVLSGPSPLLLGLVAPVAFLLPQFPNSLSSYGLLYPNILSYAILPAVVALAVIAMIRTHGRGRAPAVVGVALGVGALVCAQPNGVFALVWISVPLLVHALIQCSARLRHAGKPWWLVVTPWPAAMIVTAGVIWVADRIPLVAAYKASAFWAASGTWQDATSSVLDLTAKLSAVVGDPPQTANPTPPYIAAALVLVGLATALFVRRWRWMSFSYILLAGLFVLAQAIDIPLRATLTGFWYSDAPRLSALLPVIGVPLAVVGLGGIVWLTSHAVQRLAHLGGRTTRHGRWPAGSKGPFLLPPRLAASAAVILALLVAVAVPRMAAYKESFGYLSYVYRMDTYGDGLLSANEVKMFDDVKEIVPPNETIAGNPWDGSALVWAFTDRQYIYPHVGMGFDPDRKIVAASLRDATTNPRVCPAVKRLRLGYVLDFGHELHNRDDSGSYLGLMDLEDSGVGKLVAQEGDAKLYKITACQPVVE